MATTASTKVSHTPGPIIVGADSSLWRVTAVEDDDDNVVELASRWVVVATGENAEAKVPELKGRGGFKGGLVHSSEYRSGKEYEGKKVVVVGCGNSGMELCLDLVDHGALPSLSVRSGMHILPRELLGASTFVLAMKLLKLFPVKVVDKILLILAWVVIGDTGKYGIKRPKIGPMELKNTTGKSPVLDVGSLSLIKKGKIKIVPEVESLSNNGAKFVDGRLMEFDSVIFATGYRSNVPLWLKGCDFFSENGKPKAPYPDSWKGENGLYCVGFAGRGLLGASSDAVKVALDVAEKWKSLTFQNPSWS
ncbi:uncharacterized protein A4U43_C03F29090 [Asparagus officinalis]|uniref:Flavin-containing monooxygenase n=1 Tax=Asparagus officinalis TaxID=4686 RepID=A0A5P1FEP4_ASPOF|nr:uncharacterized protein A4U43_C03F29090 [Asparagus officinalis]